MLQRHVAPPLSTPVGHRHLCQHPNTDLKQHSPHNLYKNKMVRNFSPSWLGKHTVPRLHQRDLRDRPSYLLYLRRQREMKVAGRCWNRGASGARVSQAMTEEMSIFGVLDVV